MKLRLSFLNGVVSVMGCICLAQGIGCDSKGSKNSTPPSVPMNLVSLAATCSQVDLTWSASTDDQTPGDQVRYKVWWSTTSPASTAGPENALTGAGVTGYTVTGLTGMTHYFKVRALDGAGNLSGESVEASVSPCWTKTYGGSLTETATFIRQTTDGGFIAAGGTYSFGAANQDVWILKLTGDGSVTWQKTYGQAGYDNANSIQQTTDGGYVVAGVSDGAGNLDFWVLKLNGDGSTAWQKAYGGSGDENAFSIQQTTDGGYIVGGYTFSFGAGLSDFWVIKLTADGSVTWQKAYGGGGSESINSILQTSDGGYIAAGSTDSFGSGGEAWIFKLNSDGSAAWQKIYGGITLEKINLIKQTSDGGYMAAGITNSYGAGFNDLWVLKLNGDGSVAWQKAYGGAGYDLASSIEQTMDGGYIVGGGTYSSGAGNSDLWVLKLNSDGNVAWQKTYGGAQDEWANSLQPTSDGGCIATGLTSSFGAGFRDFWVIKLPMDGAITFASASGGQINDTTATVTTTVVTPQSTAVTPTNTSVTAASTSVSVTDTNAFTYQQAP